jgi:hypothetical protein
MKALSRKARREKATGLANREPGRLAQQNLMRVGMRRETVHRPMGEVDFSLRSGPTATITARRRKAAKDSAGGRSNAFSPSNAHGPIVQSCKNG